MSTFDKIVCGVLILTGAVCAIGFTTLHYLSELDTIDIDLDD